MQLLIFSEYILSDLKFTHLHNQISTPNKLSHQILHISNLHNQNILKYTLWGFGVLGYWFIEKEKKYLQEMNGVAFKAVHHLSETSMVSLAWASFEMEFR